MNNSNAARAAWGEALVNQKIAEKAWWTSHNNEADSKEYTSKLHDVLCACEKVAEKAETAYVSALVIENAAKADKMDAEEFASEGSRDPNDVHADIA